MVKQSIFGRISTLAKANINAMLDKAEDPQKMLDQMVRDYTNNIAEAEAAVAQTIGNLRMIEDDYREDQDASRSWGQKALAASQKADDFRTKGDTASADKFDNLAKVAIERQMDFERQAKSAEPTIASQREIVERLKTGLDQMKVKRQQLVAKRDELTARAKSAHAQSAVADAVKSIDLLDPTKIIPEELVPVQKLGKMTLNRNPDNFFAETEQAAFHIGHIVPGIDFTNDPLLQGRLFSYTDTQLLRLGGPNFHEIPINRPLCPFHNNQRDAFHRQTIHKGRANYEPNSIDNGWPKETPPAAQGGGFESYPERVEGHKIRNRSESFGDHFSQATLFWNSMSGPEKEHIIGAYTFELGKVERVFIRERQVNEILANIDLELARRVATRFDAQQGEQARERLDSPLAQRFTAAERAVGEDPEGLAEYRQRLQEHPPRGVRLELVKRLDAAARTTELASLLRYEVGKTQALLALKARGESLDEVELQAQTQQQASAIRQSSEQAVATFMLYAYRQMPSDQLAEYAALYEHASVSQLLAISLEVVPQLFAERREQLRKTASQP